MLDLIASYFVKGVNKLFNYLPIGLILWIGRRIGYVIYRFSGKRRSIAYANMKAAFNKEKTPHEIKIITKQIYFNAAQTFAELIATTKFDPKYLDKYVTLIDLDKAHEANKNPNGMIFLSAHFGNWEMMAVASVHVGFPLYQFVRDQKLVRLNGLLDKLRESNGNTVVRKGYNLKSVFKVLREGNTLAILGDQNAGVNGVLVDFFGRPASVAKGPFRFAQATGATIIMPFMHRVKGAYHECMVYGPMNIGKNDDIRPFMEEYNRMLEEEVKKHPEQWLWMHKRWKATPLRKIMVLDDGKKGHLNQSLAVFEQLKKHREDEGFNPEDTELDVFKITFKSKFTRTLFNVLCPFVGKGAQGSMKLLTWAIDNESYDRAVKSYADIIISCGSALAGVNKMLRIENNARSLVVMDPGKALEKYFDLIIVPRHDYDEKKHKKDKYVITDLAPNLIMPEDLNEYVQKKDGPCVGLLFGGDNKHFTFGEKLTKKVSSNVCRAAEKVKGCVFTTTSRRTPEKAESILSEELSGSAQSIGFVCGKNDKDYDTVKKILATSDVVLVSGESISMVSEAVASTKPVLVFMPDKVTDRGTKYESFLKGLEGKGYIKIVAPEDIIAEVEQCVLNGAKFTAPDDNGKIRENLYKLF